ncbi:GTP 3',8-cyclase MoaA [Terriglobus sp.]|uniref:GTP 3',8-cyclase MoaA n=1 Tax=Terriglobus sp. TaxID=1889013 RepID=UPI003B003BD1
MPLSPASEPRLRDRFGRAITDLRVSVTDRCNYRCVYCRTGNDGVQFSELRIEDYAAMVRLMIDLGVEKIRLTGGEPLLRRGLLDLIREVREMPLAYPEQANGGQQGVEIAMTTNGHLLAGMARDLKDAGLDRITVSMDAVTPETFARITRVPDSLRRVLDGIHAAQDAGLEPVKVNCVLLRGWNDDQIEAFGEFARRERVVLRFIEFMPLEEDRIWAPDTVVREAEIVERLQRVAPLELIPPNHVSETARRYGFIDGVGEVGVIAPVSRPFCGHCSRIRLTSDGKIRTCLFSQAEHDLYGRMHRGATAEQLRAYVRSVVHDKEERHHIGEPGFLKPSRSMVHIGG